MKRLDTVARQEQRIAVGLISGTSADGVDAAVVRIKGTGTTLAATVLYTSTLPYPDDLRARALSAAGAPASEIAELNVELGAFFAKAALRAVHAAGLKPQAVDVLGSHGQTVYHSPPSRKKRMAAAAGPDGALLGATLQLGDGCVIARATGMITVSDFRAADLAAGGEGAPLVPYLDWCLFRGLEGTTVALNLGGIANVTFVPGIDDIPIDESLARVIGFDTGPANMVLDGIAARLLPGAPPCDRDGKAAARGRVHRGFLTRLLQYPYFRRPPPKSTGREDFGRAYLEELLAAGKDLPPEDLLATAAALCADTVADAVNKFLDPDLYPPARIVVSGGGVHNCPLMAMLEERFYPIPLQSSSAFGVPADGKEAVLFAVLASEALAGTPAGLPAVTGASAPAVLGKISMPAG